MTDKIIIDGVDVLKCPYGANQFCSLCEDSCYEWWDCEFKQLQRKTTECERYKQTLDDVKNYCKEVLSDVLHYSQGAVIAAKKVQTIIEKAKESE